MADITREVALGGFLLRAYGFKNQEIYNILESKGFDLTMFHPTSGAAAANIQTGGSKNLNKDLFTEKARKRVGGKRGAPSWLPAGSALGDYLSLSLGFGDEGALDDFTLTTVGSIMSARGKSMGSLTAKQDPQRNLIQSSDWEWTNDSTVVAGTPIDEHSMSDALDTIHAGNNFDLANRVVGSPLITPPSPPPVSPSTTPGPAGPSSTPPPGPPPTDPDDMVGEAVVEPDPDEAVVDDDEDEDEDDGSPTVAGTLAGHKLLSPARPTPPVNDLPEASKATRRLNKSVWDARTRGEDQNVFGRMEITPDPREFYPCLKPIYIRLPIRFENGVIPQKDVSIRSLSEVLSLGDVWNDQTKNMILVLENNAKPYFYFEGEEDTPHFLKMSKSMTATDNTPLGGQTCVCDQLQIAWSDPGTGSEPSIPERIRFRLKTSNRAGVTGRPYEIVKSVSTPFDPNYYEFLPSTEGGGFCLTMQELVTQRNTSHFSDQANALRQDIAAGYQSDDYDPDEDLLLPIGDSIPSDQLAGPFSEGDEASVLVYGIPNYGMAGLYVESPDEDFNFGQSLIFANQGVKVYTSVDQYEGDEVGIYERKFLANLPIDWENESKVVWTVDNPPNMALKMQLQFRDSGATVSEYSGINTKDPEGPRIQTIYIPGDVPNKITPLSRSASDNLGQLTTIEAYPATATEVYERIRLTFVDGDEETKVIIPDLNDRFAGTLTTATGNRATINGEAMAFELSGEQGYIPIENHSDYDTREFMQLINEARVMTRASTLNNVIAAPNGNVKGVKQVIWSEGRTLNVLMLKPGSTDEFIHLTIVTEKTGPGE